MKLAPAICLLVLSSSLFTGLLPQAVIAQRKLPNGRPIPRSPLKATAPAPAMTPEKAANTPAPPPSASGSNAPATTPATPPAAPVTTTKMETPQGVKIEVTVPNATGATPNPQNADKKPSPCASFGNGHDWLKKTEGTPRFSAKNTPENVHGL